MIIKSQEDNKNIVLLGVMILLFIIMIIREVGSLSFGIIISIPLLFLLLRFWIATGRIFIISENGYITCFLWYRKEYKWDELCVKRIENYQNCFGDRNAYTKGVVFSPHPIHKPSWMHPYDYCMLRHPFSLCYIYFPPEKVINDFKNKRWYDTAPIVRSYEVDENEFMEKMEEWKVELEEIYCNPWK